MPFQGLAGTPERIEELLAHSVRQGASDLHLSTGLPPMLRVDGELRRIDAPVLEAGDLGPALQGIMNGRQRAE